MWVAFYNQAETTLTVNRETIPEQVTFDGVVQPVNQGTVAAQTSGRVVGMYVDVNDVVQQGDVLLEISATQQTASYDAAVAQLSQAEAQNREAQTQVKRFRQLITRGAVSQGQLDSAEARARTAAAAVKAAHAEVTRAKDALGYTSIKAPYAGIVTQRHVELGETVAPGMPLLSGYGMTPLRVEVQVPQRYHNLVKQAQQFAIQSPDGSLVQPTQYTLFRYADPQSHTFTIRLRLADGSEGELTPGMWVKAIFHTGDRDALLVPKTAVIRRGELSAVFRLKGEQQALNPVRVGQEYGESVEILSGLEVGDQIVANAFPTEAQ
ncbi:efflux RND transporter periplasmic adaptor subunit [Vibrio mangrovi]|nr:efflux RND transporter periplasmic adaptor subunit [Vibrio mangrovi]MDW6004521.1 efflux RND transporter periplasmic adaptor subunit [Vibrio mangrovi]